MAQKGEAHNPKPAKPHVLQTAEARGSVTALRYAAARKSPDGSFKVVGEWNEYQGNVADGIPATPIFDCFEADAGGVPTGFCDGACSANPGCPGLTGNRWYYGSEYNNPNYVNDMTTIAAGFNGAMSQRAEVAWWWPQAGTAFVAIFTSETFNDCLTGPPATGGDYDGVVFEFALPGPGYFYSDLDISTGALFFQMPMDGSGAYQVVLGTAVDPGTGAITLAVLPGAQPMLWGASNNETPPDGRAGTQGAEQWDDDDLPDGVHTVNECYDYSFTGVCPETFGGMILFYGEGGGPTPCYANCDESTTEPVLNVADFTCFLQRFAANDPYANCDLSTTPPTLNVADFTCFLQEFAGGCP